MTAFVDGMIVYHGSYCEVPVIDLHACSPGRDFGRGFYVTTSFEQASAFVPLSVRKRFYGSENVHRFGYVSSYVITVPEGVKVCSFAEADAQWLHFVAANRRASLFPELLKEYSDFDIVLGKVADDQTARTLQLYVSGAFGEPGDSRADEIAISLLLPNRLKDQICFRTERAVSCLSFEGSERRDI